MSDSLGWETTGGDLSNWVSCERMLTSNSRRDGPFTMPGAAFMLIEREKFGLLWAEVDESSKGNGAISILSLNTRPFEGLRVVSELERSRMRERMIS